MTITNQQWNESIVEQKVTYVLEIDGRLFLIEHVPARVNVETGEKFFSLQTVDTFRERLQKTVWEKQKPARVIETPVFEFAM